MNQLPDQGTTKASCVRQGLTYFFFPNEAVLLLFKMHVAEENGCSVPSIAHKSAVQKNGAQRIVFLVDLQLEIKDHPSGKPETPPSMSGLFQAVSVGHSVIPLTVGIFGQNLFLLLCYMFF